MSAILDWPRSPSQVERIQSERKRRAVELARRAPFFRDRLRGVDIDRLDDPDMWAKIPLLTKDALRQIPPERFHDEFCVAPRAEVVEYWRSGGVTGRPLFYPRSADDMEYSIRCFRRAFVVIGATADDLVHVSFPLGIHPVAHLYARAAEDLGIGTIWCGSGSNTPSLNQLELIRELKPTIWAGMASYGIHLANLAEAQGIDLAASSVRKIIVAAEPLSPAKRHKLERSWGAEVSDQFGMTEGALVSVQAPQHDGLHVWSDLFLCEVVDEATGEPVPEGIVGSLVITPLFNNNVTPFLRWSSGDLVSITRANGGDQPWSIFPVMRHARRTVGFFKVRGVNINHSELEDLMFFNQGITDFKAEVINAENGLDVLRLFVEPKQGVDVGALQQGIRADVLKSFEVAAEITFLDRGTIGREFEASIKAARFVDRRG
ncbi:MAG TPA: AMP-binding protein [Xanthobacteraceae bacterium]|nr:AMP-binding protein [Xanthobacteraceae bacterium]